MARKKQRLDKALHKEIESIIRVDQAGEYGAKRIYEGQLAVLKGHKEIKGMLKQELEHLDYFNNQIANRRVRPTVLMPLWHLGGFAMGAITALMGEKAAMACTVAVEEVIGGHYQEQMNTLKNHKEEQELQDSISKFRDEELEHLDAGLTHGAEETPGYEVLSSAIKAITKTAIFLSKRI